MKEFQSTNTPAWATGKYTWCLNLNLKKGLSVNNRVIYDRNNLIPIIYYSFLDKFFFYIIF